MIGVYDSGYGGLTVLRSLRVALPEADFLYLGDNGRAPYGGRDAHTILDYAEQCVEHLFDAGCRLVLVACHTVSCVALRHLQRRYVTDPSRRRILGVTIPAAEAAVAVTRGHIGVVGTTRTVASGTFRVEIAKLSGARVTQVAAPLLAPIVEEGWADTEVARLAVGRYVGGLGAGAAGDTSAGDTSRDDRSPVDTVLLGCTHYPLLIEAFRAALGPGVTVLDPAPVVAARLLDWAQRHPGFVGRGEGRVAYLCTGDPERFSELGGRFLGEQVSHVSHVSAEAGRLVSRERPLLWEGQVVR